MFYLEDGRPQLYQWDLNRRLRISDPKVTEVHFCNGSSDCALVVKTYTDDTYDGNLYAEIPNIILQSDLPIKAYAYVNDTYTKECQTFKVVKRNKPDDYVYTETEVKSWEQLETSINELSEEVNTLAEDIDKITELENKVSRYDSKIEGKVDKAGTGAYTRVYSVTPDGDQIVQNVRIAAVANAIVQRATDGSLEVPLTPTKDKQAASKKYVDNKISDAVNSVKTGTIYGGILYYLSEYAVGISTTDRFCETTLGRKLANKCYTNLADNIATWEIDMRDTSAYMRRPYYFTIYSTFTFKDVEYKAGDIVIFNYEDTDTYQWIHINNQKSNTAGEGGNVDLDGYATEDWVKNQHYITTYDFDEWEQTFVRDLEIEYYNKAGTDKAINDAITNALSGIATAEGGSY